MPTPANGSPPLYNSRILKIFLEFLKNDYPQIDRSIRRVLDSRKASSLK